jgi:hypothetical protein
MSVTAGKSLQNDFQRCVAISNKMRETIREGWKTIEIANKYRNYCNFE